MNEDLKRNVMLIKQIATADPRKAKAIMSLVQATLSEELKALLDLMAPIRARKRRRAKRKRRAR